MRRLSIVLVGAALLAAGCGGEKTVSPLPQTVEGSTPTQTTTQKPAKGDPTAGKSVFSSAGCSGCHAFKAAGSNATVGPNLDQVTPDAKKAGQGLGPFTQDSIVNPDSYIAPGFNAGVMPSTFGQSLSSKQIADLVAFIDQNQ